MKKITYILFFIFPLSGLAQNMIEPDSIALVEDRFQELFYESLKQKGIENYDRAIINLESALQLKPKETVLYHEIGKNYLAQRNYPQAEEYFLKATAQEPENRWYYLSLYDVYYQTKNYPKSIEVVKKLIGFNDKQKLDFQDDLVSLYMYTSQFDKALELIEELEKVAPIDPTREMYKTQLLKDKISQASTQELEKQIIDTPENEQAYIALIYQYSENNQAQKAFEVARRLAENLPESDWAHVSLFKFYLDQNNISQAISSMNRVFESKAIDDKIRHRVFNEFLIFVNNNPQYNTELDKAVDYFKNDPKVTVAKEVAKFYFIKQNWSKAAEYFEKSLQNQADDIEAIILLLQTYTEMDSFDVLLTKSDYYKGYFPLQPELYYYNGLAYNQAQNFRKAKQVLEEGLDYLIDNLSLEINFNIQLAQASEGLDNLKDKDKYLKKVESLMKMVE